MMFRTWTRKAGLFLIAIIAVSTLVVVNAQREVWSVSNTNRAEIIKDKGVARQSFPTEFKLFNLNIEPFRQQLFSIVGSAARQQSTVISLPNAAGQIEQFEVFEDSNFEPDLQAQFPEIRAFSGQGLTDKYATLKLSISPQGIQSMVFRTATDNEFIEPYSQDHTMYAVYSTHREAGNLPWECSTEDRHLVNDLNGQLSYKDVPLSNAGQIKTMRLAQSCNGEYANFFGAFNSSQVALVLAAFNATLTRSNGVYEKDLAVHLNLIANTTAVIYYDPATDPYTDLNSWNAQEQAVMTSNIGEANYDIGHMFGASGGGGNAGCIGCVCVNGQKGSGITSPADNIPMGDNFDIDYVVHEVGHQMGANHSFSFQLEGTGQNKEVGSGITIMGYAGITSRDVAPHSIDTFHETNIAQIQSNLAGKTCPVTTVMTANHPPVVAPLTNYTIPISTPFALTGSATDPEGDALTYQWEQNDNATTSGANSVASPTKATGPNWLSFLPTSSPTRLMPTLSTIQAGLNVTPPLPGGDAGTNIEALSSVSRTLNFRLTVRDNRPYVAGSTIGQTQFADMTVTVTNTSGPFSVTAPNTGVTIPGGSNFNVTWNVANTTLAPVSTANVKISLSTDGGVTFPNVLAASTANDGTESVAMPNVATTQGRIKVEAVGNIFFDISNANFTITSTLLAYHPPYDFDGDNKSDVSTWRGNDGLWSIVQSSQSGAQRSYNWGSDTLGDRMVPADYDGDGKCDFAVYRNGTWYVSKNSGGDLTFVWGAATDIPVPADFDNDGKADIAVYRPQEGASQGLWYVLKSSTNYASYDVAVFGASTDKPVVGDYNGDGKADYAVIRRSGGVTTWYILYNGTTTFAASSWGTDTDIAVPGDYDGDRKNDLAVWRPSTGTWYVFKSGGGIIGAQFGQAGDVLVPADYDGDQKTDLGVYRASDNVWYIQQSTAGISFTTFGGSGQTPVPSAYIMP